VTAAVASRPLSAPSPRLLGVARSASEIDAIADSWETIRVDYVDADRDYFTAVAENRDDVESAYVLVLGDDDGPRSLAVGWVERGGLACRFGYKTVYRPDLRLLRIAHGGVAGAADDASARAIVQELDHALSRGEADALLIPAVRLDSPLDRALRSMPGRFRIERPRKPSVHRRFVLPETYDEFLASRDAKSRYNLKRVCVNLEKRFGDRIELSLLSDEESFDRIFNDLESIAAKTYQRGLGAGFADTPDRRAYVRVALSRGEFRAWVLSIDAAPVAFWQGIVRDRTFFVTNAGYDPEFGKLGAGTYVQRRMFRDVIEDPLVDVVDFGWGDADYKARFGTESWFENDLLVFAPSFKGVRVRTIRWAILGADALARRAVARVGVFDKVKRVWRNRLRYGASPETRRLHSDA
jgi:hypothetical protein